MARRRLASLGDRMKECLSPSFYLLLESADVPVSSYHAAPLRRLAAKGVAVFMCSQKEGHGLKRKRKREEEEGDTA
jgi:hypothetical protein